MVLLRTDRLQIRSNDISTYRAYLTDSLQSYPFDDPTWDNTEFISMFIQLDERKMVIDPLWSYPWTVFSVENSPETGPIPAGLIGFKGYPVDSTVEIGYSLLSKFRGRGYATEMVAAMLNWAKSEGIGSVEAKTRKDNHASINVLQKCGFEFDRVVTKNTADLTDPEREMNLYSVTL
jgi:RimJ/RimL family protein N-acetyltransferase